MMNDPLRTASLILFFLFTHIKSVSAQYTLVTSSCDSSMRLCDTLSLEKYNQYGQLVEKTKKGQASGIIRYTYNDAGKLVIKEHFDEQKQLEKQNRIVLDSTGEWRLDSLLDSSGKLLYLFKREKREDRENTWQIDWYFRSDSVASTRQLNRHKSYCELWVYEPGGTNPALKETEEWYFENEEHAKGSIRFAEPEHRIVARFKYIVVR
jgi:YD repeat-containing protein